MGITYATHGKQNRNLLISQTNTTPSFSSSLTPSQHMIPFIIAFLNAIVILGRLDAKKARAEGEEKQNR